ncbi:MAG: SGNH/GDSL hydrolase family protein [Gemmatimonadaceae bacterium]|nr:SGNH/GDSL hydrolase family protein [Gemmatimonadaceae bacterium]
MVARIITFGDSNTDRGYAGAGASIVALSYVSVDYERPAASAPNNSTQLAGKIESQWAQRYSPAIVAVNHAIGGTTSGSGRTQYGSPNALTPVNGITRFDAEVLGLGSPWNGGELANLVYSGPITRARSFTPTVNDFVYVSIGTNDQYYGVSAAQTVANIGTMIDKWVARGLPANHFIVTTLGPSPISTSMPAVNTGIRSLVAQKGIRMIDLATYLSPDNGLTWHSQNLVVQDGTGAHYAEGVRSWLADQVATIMGAVTAPR